MRADLALSLSFAVAAGVLVACVPVGGLLSAVNERLPGVRPEAIGPAPDFVFDTFSGERVALSDLRGRAVVLNFWASWCLPCRTEMPDFERVYRAYRDRGVVFVGLAVQDDPQAAREFVQALGISYPVGIDYRNAASTAYEVVGLPTTVFIQSDGTVQRRWNGPVDEQQLLELVKRIAG